MKLAKMPSYPRQRSLPNISVPMPKLQSPRMSMSKPTIPKMDSASKLIPSLPMKKRRSESPVYAMILSRDWDNVSGYALDFPKEISKRIEVEIAGAQGKTNLVLPIHAALANGAPLFVVQNLLHAYPKGIAEVESATGRLPLHIAALEDTPVETFEFLVMAHVEGLRRLDVYGSTPMHHAVYRGNKLAIGRMLFHDRDCGLIPDKEGNTPLHLAAQYWSGAGDVYQLACDSTNSLFIKNKQGMMPVEVAQRFGHGESFNALNSLMYMNQGGDVSLVSNDLSRSQRGSIIRNGMKRVSSIARIGQRM